MFHNYPHGYDPEEFGDDFFGGEDFEDEIMTEQLMEYPQNPYPVPSPDAQRHDMRPDHYDRHPDRDRDRYPDHRPGRRPGRDRDRYPDHRPGRRPDYDRDRYPGRGDGRQPSAPPPGYTPQKQQGLRAVDPGAMNGCLYRNTYVWLDNRQSFWFYPTYVGRHSVSGYRWTYFGWAYTGFDLNMVESFYCMSY